MNIFKYLFDEPKKRHNPWNAKDGWIVHTANSIPVEYNRWVDCYVDHDRMPFPFFDNGTAENFNWNPGKRSCVMAYKPGSLWKE